MQDLLTTQSCDRLKKIRRRVLGYLAVAELGAYGCIGRGGSVAAKSDGPWALLFIDQFPHAARMHIMNQMASHGHRKMADWCCSICLTDSRKMDQLLTPCGHHYHADCLRPWVLQHRSCPLCKASIMIDECRSLPPCDTMDLKIRAAKTSLGGVNAGDAPTGALATNENLEEGDDGRVEAKEEVSEEGNESLGVVWREHFRSVLERRRKRVATLRLDLAVTGGGFRKRRRGAAGCFGVSNGAKRAFRPSQAHSLSSFTRVLPNVTVRPCVDTVADLRRSVDEALKDLGGFDGDGRGDRLTLVVDGGVSHVFRRVGWVTTRRLNGANGDSSADSSHSSRRQSKSSSRRRKKRKKCFRMKQKEDEDGVKSLTASSTQPVNEATALLSAFGLPSVKTTDSDPNWGRAHALTAPHSPSLAFTRTAPSMNHENIEASHSRNHSTVGTPQNPEIFNSEPEGFQCYQQQRRQPVVDTSLNVQAVAMEREEGAPSWCTPQNHRSRGERGGTEDSVEVLGQSPYELAMAMSTTAASASLLLSQLDPFSSAPVQITLPGELGLLPVPRLEVQYL